MNAAAQLAKEANVTVDVQGKATAETYGWVPCRLSLQIPISRFTVRDLLRLRPGSILTTNFHHANDIPLCANGLLIGWTEFEVIGNRLAVRITELA
jgi:flagellar motor switch protein FliN/FliY